MAKENETPGTSAKVQLEQGQDEHGQEWAEITIDQFEDVMYGDAPELVLFVDPASPAFTFHGIAFISLTTGTLCTRIVLNDNGPAPQLIPTEGVTVSGIEVTDNQIKFKITNEMTLKRPVAIAFQVTISAGGKLWMSHDPQIPLRPNPNPH